MAMDGDVHSDGLGDGNGLALSDGIGNGDGGGLGNVDGLVGKGKARTP